MPAFPPSMAGIDSLAALEMAEPASIGSETPEWKCSEPLAQIHPLVEISHFVLIAIEHQSRLAAS
jgi:hypothetical protein